ncbi:hypothetical protein AGLY_007061 [Aphis glycines]|uniref:Uncharacterized protein n=1 Tax=Aphis glycines TaxID=307491 RepID=A0A6G0TQE9_APHGL|nr:hypothetical protein AGLY_007061 [Aphis glycines]
MLLAESSFQELEKRSLVDSQYQFIVSSSQARKAHRNTANGNTNFPIIGYYAIEPHTCYRFKIKIRQKTNYEKINIILEFTQHFDYTCYSHIVHDVTQSACLHGSNLTDPVKQFSLDQLEGTRGNFQTPAIEFPPATSCDNKLRNDKNINNNDCKTAVYLNCLPKTPLNIISKNFSKKH